MRQFNFAKLEKKIEKIYKNAKIIKRMFFQCKSGGTRNQNKKSNLFEDSIGIIFEKIVTSKTNFIEHSTSLQYSI